MVDSLAGLWSSDARTRCRVWDSDRGLGGGLSPPVDAHSALSSQLFRYPLFISSFLTFWRAATSAPAAMSLAHVPKRFASTAARQAHAHAHAGGPYWHAHVALSNLDRKAFPPEEVRPVKVVRGGAVKTAMAVVPAGTTVAGAAGQEEPQFFDAETWASLQPPNPASLSAFAHRVGLGSLLEAASSRPSSSASPSPGTSQAPTALLQQALTHRSFVPLYQKHNPGEPAPQTNTALASLGNSLLGLFATEYVNAAYPYLPTRVLQAAVTAYVGATTCTTIAKEMGATPLVRWHRLVSVVRTHSGVTLSDHMSFAHRSRVLVME